MKICHSAYGNKTGGGPYKLWFDTIYNDIGLMWSVLQAKKGAKKGPKRAKTTFGGF